MIPFSFVLAIIVASYASKHTTSFEGANAYALIFSFILTLLGCTIPCAIFCIISLIRKERLALFSLIPGIPCGIIALLFAASLARGYIAVKAENSKREASSTLEKKLLADAHADATCILKDRWDLQPDDAHIGAMNSALLDPEVRISEPLAHEIYQTMPAARDKIIQRPVFDGVFLRNLFQEIEARSHSFKITNENDADVYMLSAIASNPNCPNEILEAIITASEGKGGWFYWAKDKAQKRLNTLKEKPSPSTP